MSDLAAIPEAHHVLIVEDDLPLGRQLVQHLASAELKARWLQAGRELSSDELKNTVLVVLDLMLPGRYGLDILKQLRTFSDVPVLVLSARNDTSDKVRALKLGADDYLTKPFWPEEFIERVRARLRRPLLSERERTVEVGSLRIATETRTATLAGVPVALTPVEFALLAVLAERPGAAITRRLLAERVLDPEREGDERTLDAHVSRLRKKLAPHRLVETVWGIGYRLAPPADS